MKTLRFTNCLIGKSEGGCTTLYAPRTSTCLVVPSIVVDNLLMLGLRKKEKAESLVFSVISKAMSKEEAEEVIGVFLKYGVLIRQEYPPAWDLIPDSQEKSPVDILLIVANYPNAGNFYSPVPFGVMLIATVLREVGFSVAILDMSVKKLEAWKVVSYLRQYQPKMVGISAITAAGNEAYKVASWVQVWAQNEKPNFKGIILGGHHATDFMEQALSSGLFEIILTGKLAFLTAPSAFHALVSEKPRDILGAYWNYKGREIRPIQNEGWLRYVEIPIPSWDLINKSDYPSRGATFSSLGCPFQCAYCTLGGRPAIHRPLSEVKKEFLSSIKDGYNVLSLYDDEFLHNKNHVAEFAGMLEQEPTFRHVKLALQCRTDSVEARYNDGLLKRIRSAVSHLYLEMGLDGLTEKDLTLVRKGGSADIKSPFRVLDIAKKLDIEIGFGSIFGFPWNTRSDLDSQSAHIHSVIDYGKEIGVTPLIMGGAFTPFPGSSLGRKVFGGELVGVKVVRQEPEFFDFHRPNIDTPNWSHQELENFLVKHFKSLMERG